jgi:aquaglyceroporin related protein
MADVAQSQIIREGAAEFLGVMIMIIFGTGVVCQITLSANPNISPSPKGVRIFKT